jgi:oxygen-dependent protoporphyrinogen oxidase
MARPIVAVVGAGAAGLGAALELHDRGLQPIVLEAGAHAGGKVQSMRLGDYLVEWAAHGILDRRGELRALSERLGLQPLAASATAHRRWVVRDGELYALTTNPAAFALSGLLSAAEKARVLAEPFIARRKVEGSESVRAFFARRLGPGGAFLGEALQTGIYAGDPDQLEMGACFPLLAELERDHGGLVAGMAARAASVVSGRLHGEKRPRSLRRLTSFAAGLGELMAALSGAIGDGLRLSTSVRAIRRVGARFRLTVEERGAAPSELSCDALCVALPALQAAAALEPLDAELAAQLRALEAAPISTVHLGVRREDVLGDVNGFGLLAPGRRVIGTLLPSSLWPGRAPDGRVLLTALVGGARNPTDAALPDDELVALVRDELALTVRLKRDAQPEMVKIVRVPQAIPQYTLGHRARVAAIEERTARHPRLRLTGASYRGVSVLDCLRDGRAQAEQLALEAAR